MPLMAWANAGKAVRWGRVASAPRFACWSWLGLCSALVTRIAAPNCTELNCGPVGVYVELAPVHAAAMAFHSNDHRTTATKLFMGQMCCSAAIARVTESYACVGSSPIGDGVNSGSGRGGGSPRRPATSPASENDFVSRLPGSVIAGNRSYARFVVSSVYWRHTYGAAWYRCAVGATRASSWDCASRLRSSFV